MAVVEFVSPSLRCEWLRTSSWNPGSHSEPLQAGGQSGPGIIKRSARHPLQVPGSPNGTMSFKVEEMEVKIGRVKRNENEPVRRPRGPRWANGREGKVGFGGAESSVGAFLCDYMFNLLHISKKKERKEKMSAMTEPICSDPGVSVRQTKRRLQWNRSPQPLMESQWTSEAGGSARADSPAIRVEDPLYLQQPPSPLPVCYYRFTLSGLERRLVETEGAGGKVWGRKKWKR